MKTVKHDFAEGDVELSLVQSSSDAERASSSTAWRRPLTIVACLGVACLVAAGAAASKHSSLGRRAGAHTPRVVGESSSLVWLQEAELSEECVASATTAADCGIPGQTQAQCAEKGCCYDESNGAHWCWYPAGAEEPAGAQEPVMAEEPGGGEGDDKCNTDGELIDCGKDGFTQESCQARGCCYDETAKFWCFSKEGAIAKLTADELDPPEGDDEGGDEAVDEAGEQEVAPEDRAGDQEGSAESAAEQEEEEEEEEEKPEEDAAEEAGVEEEGEVEDASMPSLFCFSVLARAGDDQLMKIQETTGTSIFSCDDWGKFTSNTTVGRETAGWALTDTFIAAWELLKDDGRYDTHDYVVKVDVDTVFFPDRLRSWLGKNDPPGEDVYISNCKSSPSGLSSSLEVFSTSAVNKYLEKIDSCQTELDYAKWSDDTFILKCMAGFDVVAWDLEDLVCDEECSCDPSPCSPGKIGYHPLGEAGAYDQCVKDASR